MFYATHSLSLRLPLPIPKDLVFVGAPVIVVGQRYHRNALLFNMVFVLHPAHRHVASFQWAPVALKMAHYLRTLEHESNFLSSPNTKQQLPHMMHSLFRQLNTSAMASLASGGSSDASSSSSSSSVMMAEARVPADVANTFFVRLCDPPVRLPPLSEWQVPVPVADLQPWVSMDLTMAAVIPHLDGESFVRNIALESGVALPLVIRCVQLLVLAHRVVMVDVFQYSNSYATTPRITELFASTRLQQQCLEFVTRRGNILPPFKRVFQLYCAFRPGITVKQLAMEAHTQELGLSDQRIVLFGLLNGILRRVHRYPILTSLPQQLSAAQRAAAAASGAYSTFPPITNPTPQQSKPAPPSMPNSTTTSTTAAPTAANTSTILTEAETVAAAAAAAEVLAASSLPKLGTSPHGTASRSWIASAAALSASRAQQQGPAQSGSGNTAPTTPQKKPHATTVVQADFFSDPAVLAMLDGTHCADELCCLLGRSWTELATETPLLQHCIIIERFAE